MPHHLKISDAHPALWTCAADHERCDGTVLTDHTCSRAAVTVPMRRGGKLLRYPPVSSSWTRKAPTTEPLQPDLNIVICCFPHGKGSYHGGNADRPGPLMRPVTDE